MQANGGHASADREEIVRATALRVNATVKGYHECNFTVAVGEYFSIGRKRGERGNALRVYNEMGQLGHLQKELVDDVWPIIHRITDW